ncbi:hypothetical protein CAEBREN_28113 [Caenorhabditis brenneri]|uniref:SoHo domain-containing protein n=1 Tax=Caenorhabditis brenneri TaxID=135651 RepID=G0N6B0_CAEBE|nr:hypothetical protein CAEBREN_28113 [Caenorhabditis brenneri]
MMHHPSQFGSNLKEPDHAAAQYSQHPQSFETENNNSFNPKGNVAALRSVIHGQLDMKTPTGKAPSNSSRYQKPAPPPVDPTPSWAKNVKVYEPSGYVDPHLNKHNMGRVLDGPVNPNKFFQGVPPPSYSQVKPGTDTKPPAPPSSKPPIQQTPAQALQAQVLHNEKPPVDPYRPSSKTTSYRIPYDVALDPRHHFGGEFDIDDSASIISSSCTFGDSSEIAAFSAAAEQRHLYEQYRKKLMEEKNELKEGSETPCVSLSEKIPEKMTTSMEEPTVSRSLFDTELTPFGHTITAPAAPSSIMQNQPALPEVQKPNNPFLDLQNLNIQNSPKQFSTPSPNPFNYSPNNEKRSIDLESSQLLVKPKSPAPYSTSSTDHYGTIRRKHKPVAIDLSSESSKSSPKDRSPHFFVNSFGNGNGFEEKQQGSMKNLSPLSPSYKDQSGLVGKSDSLNESLNQAFEIASAIESTKNNYEAPPTPKSLTGDRSISDTYPVSSPPPSHPSASTSQQWIPPSTTPVDASSMSNSMMSTSVPNMDDSIVFQGVAGGGGGGSADSSPDRHEDMSQWYRKMFKQMHKKGDEKKDNYNKEQEQLQSFASESSKSSRIVSDTAVIAETKDPLIALTPSSSNPS